MLKEGNYCEVLDKDGNAFCLLKVYNDKSHNLKIISHDIRTGEFKVAELYSSKEVKNLYKFLKEHFEGEDAPKFTHEEYLEYVAAMKTENCPEEDIATEEKWRADLKAEFGDDDE